MKKLLFSIFCFALSTSIFSQEQIRKFTPSMKVGAGSWTDEPSEMNVDLGLQGEYKPNNHFSVYGNISYNRMFEITEVSYGYNHMTFLAGPRVYLNKSIFTGVGAGYLMFFWEGYTEGSFAFSPHIGFDRTKSQWTINYTATTKYQITGFISVAAAFKFGTKRSAK